MDTNTTYECNGKPFKITIKPPFELGTGHPYDYELNYTVEVTDRINRSLYTGTISALLAVHIEKTYGTTIHDFLTNAAKTIIENRN